MESSSSSLPPVGQGTALQGGGRMEMVPLLSLRSPSAANKEKERGVLTAWKTGTH